jgi:predicted DNA-binding protein (UPF0278 family)
MAAHEKYVCDADCLISLHRHFGRTCLRHLRALAKREALKLPEGIVREIKRQTDKLAKFVEVNERFIIVSVTKDIRIRDEFTILDRRYGQTILYGRQKYDGFWKSRGGRKAADAQVVAVGKVLDGTAVSDDQAIKLACSLEGVTCIGWAEFARRLNIAKQLEFNI